MNANYPTVAGIADHEIIGEIDMMDAEHTCRCGGIRGTNEDAQRALAEARDQLAGAGWRNIRLGEARPVVDAAAMLAIAERLSEETGIPVHYDRSYDAGLYVMVGVTVRTEIDPTAAAVRAAAADQTASPWNLPYTSTNSVGGSWWEDDEETLRRRRGRT